MTRYTYLGQAVVLLRAEQGWSLQQLAVRANVDAKVIANFERGPVDPRLDIVEKIARGLSMPASQLLRFADRLRDTVETRADDVPLLHDENWRAA